MYSATMWTFPMLFFCVLFVLNVELLSGETIMGKNINDDFDFDGLPGAMHEFKVEVGGGGEECFFQRAVNTALLHVSFEVLRGGDRKVDVVIRNRRGEVVDARYWETNAIMELTATQDDTFMVCLDNRLSRMAGKLVYVYIMTFVMANWDAYIKEFDDLSYVASNISHSLNNVEFSLQQMLKSQTHARFNVIKDYYLLLGNLRYVQIWSMCQIVVIVASSIAQVVFLRRMFRTTSVTPTAKPRA